MTWKVAFNWTTFINRHGTLTLSGNESFTGSYLVQVGTLSSQELSPAVGPRSLCRRRCLRGTGTINRPITLQWRPLGAWSSPGVLTPAV